MNRELGIVSLRPQRRFGPRARRRMEIAAGLLHHSGLNVSLQGEAFYLLVLRIVDRMGETDRAALRALVDWVEQYEQVEALASARPTLHVVA